MSESMTTTSGRSPMSMSESTTTASGRSHIIAVPDDILQMIVRHLSALDLCHVAVCSRWLRCATNRDSVWRPLCHNRGWERYGTTTDLAKIASYAPADEADGTSRAGDESVPFQGDRIVTDSNTEGLTSTCRWKAIYMRAHHLHQNWVRNSSHFEALPLEQQVPQFRVLLVDGDLLTFDVVGDELQVYDMRQKTLQCAIPLAESGCTPQAWQDIKFRDGKIVVPCSGGVANAFDAKTGKLLQQIEGNWGLNDVSLVFDGELVITYVRTYQEESDEMFRDIYVWGVTDGTLQHILAVDPGDGVNMCFNVDYRDKMVAAVYDDRRIRVWDARSGECLHKLECRGQMPVVKLGQNVVVGFGTRKDVGVCDITIWSRDTGACRKTIGDVPMHSSDEDFCDLVVDTSIVLQLVGGRMDIVYAYNLRGELVTKMANSYEVKAGNGSKRLYCQSQGRNLQIWREVIGDATPNGIETLFEVSRTPVLWIDNIRRISYDSNKQRLEFYHYW